METLNSCAIQAAKGYFTTRYPQAKITPSFYYNGKEKKCVLLNYFDSTLKSATKVGWRKYAVETTGKSEMHIAHCNVFESVFESSALHV